jgi:hypothetical protein
MIVLYVSKNDDKAIGAPKTQKCPKHRALPDETNKNISVLWWFKRIDAHTLLNGTDTPTLL